VPGRRAGAPWAAVRPNAGAPGRGLSEGMMRRWTRSQFECRSKWCRPGKGRLRSRSMGGLRRSGLPCYFRAGPEDPRTMSFGLDRAHDGPAAGGWLIWLSRSSAAASEVAAICWSTLVRPLGSHRTNVLIVEARHRDILRHAKPCGLRTVQRAHADLIIAGDERGAGLLLGSKDGGGCPTIFKIAGANVQVARGTGCTHPCRGSAVAGEHGLESGDAFSAPRRSCTAQPEESETERCPKCGEIFDRTHRSAGAIPKVTASVAFRYRRDRSARCRGAMRGEFGDALRRFPRGRNVRSKPRHRPASTKSAGRRRGCGRGRGPR